MKFNRVAILLILRFALWGDAPAQNTRVRWSPSLMLESRKAIAARLARPFGDVFEGTANGEKATVSNCNDYLRLSGKGFKATDSRAAAVLHNDAVECVVLQMLQSARAPRGELLNGFQLNSESLSVLPPELAPAVSNDLIDKAKAADAAGQSWKTYIPDAAATASGEGQLDISQPGWKTHLTWYSSGDFSGHGNEELLVRADYHAEGGTYSNSQLFLLARGNAGAKRLRLVREVSIPG